MYSLCLECFLYILLLSFQALLFLQKLVNSFGTPSIEGFSAMNRIENLLHIPSLCFSQAISSFAGQNIRKPVCHERPLP